MANLTIDKTKVRLVRATVSELLTAPAGEAGNAGQYYRLNPTTGRLEKGNATSATELGEIGGMLLEDAAVGMAATIALPGAIVDVGGAVDGLNFGAKVFVSDTDATFADSAGTVTRVAAVTIPGFASTGGDRLLRMSEV